MRRATKGRTMKLRCRFPVLGTAILSLAALVFTPSAVAEPFNAGSYWTFKAGALNIDDSDKEAIQFGLGFGYQFPKGFAFEAEAHRSFDDGKADGVKYTYDSIAAFVAFRTTSRIFWKVRFGYGASEINFEQGGNNLDGEGQQYGMGVGGKRFEIEWTRMFIQRVDIDMLTINFRFGDGTK